MIDALGLLEVRGLTCGIEAADAMLKAASVRLLRQAVTNPALVTLVVEGDLAACRAALDAGAALATRRGCLVSRKEIGRPEDDTAYLLGSLLDAGQGPAPAPAPVGGATSPVPATADDRRLQVVDALVGLGWNVKVAEQAVATVLEDVEGPLRADEVPGVLRAALRSLGGGRG